MNPIVNVIDTEWNIAQDLGVPTLTNVIEVGLTTVSLTTKSIIKTYSFPVKPYENISKETYELTGWTTKKLEKQGLHKEIVERLFFDKFGYKHRLMVTDSDGEWSGLYDDKAEDYFFPPTFNIKTLLALMTGRIDKYMSLDDMLNLFNLKFEGRKHRASNDSYNIARVFIETLKVIDCSWLDRVTYSPKENLSELCIGSRYNF